MPELIVALEQMGWNLPTGVQDDAIPLILGGGDVMIAAETGSGKTAAYCLPLLQLFCEQRTMKKHIVHGDGSKTSVGWNPQDKDENLLLTGDRVCRSAQNWSGIRADSGVAVGKHFFSVTIVSPGMCRLGIVSSTGSRTLGSDRESYALGSSGQKSHSRNYEAFGPGFGTVVGEVIGCYFDLDAGHVGFTLNGADLGIAYTFPPKETAFFPAITCKDATVRGDLETSWQDYQPISAGSVVHSGHALEQSSTSPFAIVLTSTRELSYQVLSLLEELIPSLSIPVTAGVLAGGVAMDQMIKQCKQKMDVIVGTPGTVATLIKANVLDVRAVRYLVLDEADFLVESQSNKQDIGRLHKAIGACQVVICSATLHVAAITELSDRLCSNPSWVDLKGKDSVPETVSHCSILIDPVRSESSWRALVGKVPSDMIHEHEQKARGSSSSADVQSLGVKHLKLRVLVEVVERFKITQAIIFCRTQLDCDNLEQFLSSPYATTLASSFSSSSSLLSSSSSSFSSSLPSSLRKFSCAVLHRGRTDRTGGLERFSEGKVQFLIATDLGARGLDVPEVPFVINFSLPERAETYIHRVGRVGRAGLRGLAINLVNTVQERVWYHTCKNSATCHNTALIAENGCTIWQDEPALLRAIETRLGEKVQKVQLEVLQGFVDRMSLKITEVLSGASLQSKLHVGMLKPALAKLTSLETQSQQMFLFNQNSWIQSKTESKP